MWHTYIHTYRQTDRHTLWLPESLDLSDRETKNTYFLASNIKSLDHLAFSSLKSCDFIVWDPWWLLGDTLFILWQLHTQYNEMLRSTHYILRQWWEFRKIEMFILMWIFNYNLVWCWKFWCFVSPIWISDIMLGGRSVLKLSIR